jgi:hypothetical protein
MIAMSDGAREYSGSDGSGTGSWSSFDDTSSEMATEGMERDGRAIPERGPGGALSAAHRAQEAAAAAAEAVEEEEDDDEAHTRGALDALLMLQTAASLVSPVAPPDAMDVGRGASAAVNGMLARRMVRSDDSARQDIAEMCAASGRVIGAQVQVRASRCDAQPDQRSAAPLSEARALPFGGPHPLRAGLGRQALLQGGCPAHRATPAREHESHPGGLSLHCLAPGTRWQGLSRAAAPGPLARRGGSSAQHAAAPLPARSWCSGAPRLPTRR